ncbi:uncharacterized protein LOC123510454 [Portunus trituberculatus]|uniref:uncharacterized protein LOC123510454 n=1 Tax=Portunus trituberculatus TaxID=210409 RepID=UPI001E1CDA81|nr:uncharacterized protein LOC123510454 [Portunus trituberculatus]
MLRLLPFRGLWTPEARMVRFVSLIQGTVYCCKPSRLWDLMTVSLRILNHRWLLWSICFEKGLQEEDYRAISEDPVTRRPNNCPALATVECNPQISGALKTDPRKADSRLKEGNPPAAGPGASGVNLLFGATRRDSSPTDSRGGASGVANGSIWRDRIRIQKTPKVGVIKGPDSK